MASKNKRSLSRTTFEEETAFKGSLKFASSLTIRGHFEGDIETSGNLIIDDTAKVKASIKAKELLIAGEVTGDCYVTEKLEMTDTARLCGNIKTKILKIADGVNFEGKCEMIKDAKPT